MVEGGEFGVLGEDAGDVVGMGGSCREAEGEEGGAEDPGGGHSGAVGMHLVCVVEKKGMVSVARERVV
ncbi:hypothetical protein MLD38_028178 [Melastoma candidum]|uniref:Uncharacterized protein n=1 Tax=Melastoma candidum TaxID=119954 RepID=A0ACB9N138_9MYRT|nr:hypothetical protein MLD38_028178 [Melastoma candidum]